MKHRPAYQPRRSVLFVPSINDRALEKAKTLPVDSIIFDLEDSVSPEMKETARAKAADAVASGDYGNREIVIRINAYDSPWGREDLKQVVATGPDAILVPKISEPDQISEIVNDLSLLGANEELKLWVMIETPSAVLNAYEIARTSEKNKKLSCFVLGLNDLSKLTGAQIIADRFAFLSWISTCVAAARACNLTILDSVYNDYSDHSGFKEECVQGRQLGMDGKTLIHPSQVATANNIFAPNAEELAWAQK